MTGRARGAVAPCEPLVACAGWSLRPEHASLFGADGSHLERYASSLRAVEINSSFYRSHRRRTYERWAASVPAGFRFAVKAPRTITHDRHLIGAQQELTRFLDEAGGLGAKLGPLLVQLPPSLALDLKSAHLFFGALREAHLGQVACEPRHRTWFTPQAEQLLLAYQVARVAADPAPAPGAGRPGAWRGLTYYRLHGSPEMYTSSYDEPFLDELGTRLWRDVASGPAWVIFDNTRYGAATLNALWLERRLLSGPPAAARAAER
ncbi:MAG TPA: DUF72 domain-containing protein [Candidatus Limnocylindrales bacterium]|nr:DUF72 domain-containing protein [Candidatus Limnocylindrales bacterium]